MRRSVLSSGKQTIAMLLCHVIAPPDPRRLSAPAEMTAGENRREVRCLAAWVRCRGCCYVGGRRQGGGATQTCPSIV